MLASAVADLLLFATFREACGDGVQLPEWSTWASVRSVAAGQAQTGAHPRPPRLFGVREIMTSQLFVNGKVFTRHGEEDFVTAFRITDGVFFWVGDRADVGGEPAVDLQGRTVVPGFLDVHTHPAFMATLVDAVMCLPPEVNSLAGLLDKLRTHPNLGRGEQVYPRLT